MMSENDQHYKSMLACSILFKFIKIACKWKFRLCSNNINSRKRSYNYFLVFVKCCNPHFFLCLSTIKCKSIFDCHFLMQ